MATQAFLSTLVFVEKYLAHLSETELQSILANQPVDNINKEVNTLLLDACSQQPLKIPIRTHTNMLLNPFSFFTYKSVLPCKLFVWLDVDSSKQLCCPTLLKALQQLFLCYGTDNDEFSLDSPYFSVVALDMYTLNKPFEVESNMHTSVVVQQDLFTTLQPALQPHMHNDASFERFKQSVFEMKSLKSQSEATLNVWLLFLIHRLQVENDQTTEHQLISLALQVCDDVCTEHVVLSTCVVYCIIWNRPVHLFQNNAHIWKSLHPFVFKVLGSVITSCHPKFHTLVAQIKSFPHRVAFVSGAFATDNKTPAWSDLHWKMSICDAHLHSIVQHDLQLPVLQCPEEWDSSAHWTSWISVFAPTTAQTAWTMLQSFIQLFYHTTLSVDMPILPHLEMMQKTCQYIATQIGKHNTTFDLKDTITQEPLLIPYQNMQRPQTILNLSTWMELFQSAFEEGTCVKDPFTREPVTHIVSHFSTLASLFTHVSESSELLQLVVKFAQEYPIFSVFVEVAEDQDDDSDQTVFILERS